MTDTFNTTDRITFTESAINQEKVQIVIRQTSYTEEEAHEKLKHHNYDEIAVIKEYLGIKKNKVPTNTKSLNQEIYRQLRYRLDSNMRDYNTRVEKGEARKI
jgi:hypothetical protein